MSVVKLAQLKPAHTRYISAVDRRRELGRPYALTGHPETAEFVSPALRGIEAQRRLHGKASIALTIGVDGRFSGGGVRTSNPPGLLPGQDVLAALDGDDRIPFEAMLLRVREDGRAPAITVRFGTDRAPWTAQATNVTSGNRLGYRIQFLPAGAGSHADVVELPEIGFDSVIEQLPDAFVAVDRRGVVLRANRAFLDLVQVATAGAVLGVSLGRWLAQPACDFPALLASLHRSPIRLLETTIAGDLGAGIPVELSAAGNADEGAEYFGFMIRDVSRRPVAPTDGQLAAVLDAVTGQIGRTPLLQVVRETADAVERHYIRAALARVDGNRTAAAELLGLSRQSLHTKLNRYAGDGPHDAQSWAATS